MSTAKTIPMAVINPDAPPDSLEAKQPPIDNGAERYGKEGYFSRDYMAREWERLWTRSWLIAGVDSDLAEVGDFFLFDIRQESIIVTRTDEGIKAFYNVCSHRGTRLVWEERGNKRVFVCPFHSWSFTNNGGAAQDNRRGDLPARGGSTSPRADAGGLRGICGYCLYQYGRQSSPTAGYDRPAGGLP